MSITCQLPMADAVACWQMNSPADETGTYVLTSVGAVTLGESMSDADAAASRVRGGDGHALTLRGGFAQVQLPAPGKPWSLCVRLCAKDGKWGGSICSARDEHGMRQQLFGGEIDGQYALAYQIRTDFREEPLQLVAPLSMIGADGWHDLLVRYTGPKLELFCDGVLIDEEWPIGNVPQGTAEHWRIGAGWDDAEATPFQGMIDHLAVWSRPLTDEEIATLSGGAASVAARATVMLGKEQPVTQYWTPRGHNTGVGDCMPFFHDGRFHLFYLFDRRHHRSKWGLGAHQWAHISTCDLRHWEHHPMAIPISEEWEGSICTGSVFCWQGTYYAFYATRTTDGSPATLHASVSTDGIHFTKQPPLAELTLPYRPGPARDPMVFHHTESDLFQMIVTTELAESPVARHGGCLATLTSSDLQHWQQGDPFIVPGYTDQPECPDYFYWNGWYYLIFSNHGMAHYRMARNPLGPWLRPKQDAFDGTQAVVMKTAAFIGNRRLGVAFVPDHGYAGNLLIREIIQHADGTLGTAFPEEMRRDGVPVTGCWQALSAEVVTTVNEVCINAPEGFGVAALTGMPQNMYLSMRIEPGDMAATFGLCLRGTGAYEQGHELRIEPRRGKVGWCTPQSNELDEDASMSIYGVEQLDRPFTLEVIAQDDLLDLCVDGRRTLVVRVDNGCAGNRLFFFAQNGNITFRDIAITTM